MRDILLTLIVFGALPFVFRRPWLGVMLWSWLSYMNPHRLTWGFAYNLPFAQIVAVVLLISIFISKEKKTIPVDGLLVVWILFLLWMTITTIFAVHPEWAVEYYIRTMKIQFLTFITMMVMRDMKRIDLLIWTIALSIGFYSIKGGIFTLLTGGQYRVYGPAQSFIAENNALGVASLMIIPLFYYLYQMQEKPWVKLGLLVAIFTSGLAVLGSQSRGALVSIAAVLGYFWLQSRGKLITGALLVLLGIGTLAFMPSQWEERMESIQNYEEDASAMGRITAWTLSINIANAHFTGGGFQTFSDYTYARYLHPVKKPWVAHSIYFSVLAEHGWLGLILFLMIFLGTWVRLLRIIRRTRGDPELKQFTLLAKMLILSLVVYGSGGAFLSLSYWDLPWHIVAIAYLLKYQVNDRLGDASSATSLAVRNRRSRQRRMQGRAAGTAT